MKFLFGLAILFGAAQAEAVTLTCSTHNGSVAYVSFANNQAQVSWASYRMPTSPNLRFNGFWHNSGYYRSSNWTLEVQRSVFQTGVGKLWLHYPVDCSRHDRFGRRPRHCHGRHDRHDRRDRDDRPMKRSVTIYCR